MQETWAQSLGREDPLEKEMATHCSILAWEIPYGQRNLVGYSSWGSQKVGHNLAAKQEQSLQHFCSFYSCPITKIYSRNQNSTLHGPWALQLGNPFISVLMLKRSLCLSMYIWPCVSRSLCLSVYIWPCVSISQCRTTRGLSLEINYRVMEHENDVPRNAEHRLTFCLLPLS